MPRQPHLHGWRYLARLPGWLDRQPLWRVVTAGVVLGLGLGTPGFVYLRSPAWLLLWGVLFVALWRLADSAEPGFEEDTARAVETRPQWVRDGPLLMVDLPGGQFRMGSPDTDEMAHDNEKPQHEVTVSGFRMAVTPVTVGLYNEVMQKEPVLEETARLPAVDTTWYDAIEFCNRLSIREGYRPCYRQRFKRWVCDWRADGYRLPTEAEWEYACRAGTTTRYAFGDDPGRLGDYAWFAGNSSRHVHEVAQKRPNGWGLYDMHGNVWEWCWDWCGPYDPHPVTNPRGPKKPSSDNPRRVGRGGSFDVSPGRLRAAFRDDAHPLSRYWVVGFRCARVPPAS